MRLHIGCGKRNFGPDWTHIDGGNFSHLDSHDIAIPGYDDNSVDLIYASHLISYFDREEVLPLLKRWHSKLKPGGILRVAVPDFDHLMMAINFYGYKLKDILGPLYGKMQMNDHPIYHKTVYDYHDLKEVLRNAGFSHVRRYNWRDTDHAQFDDHSQAYLPHMDKEHGMLISLNVEAVK